MSDSTVASDSFTIDFTLWDFHCNVEIVRLDNGIYLHEAVKNISYSIMVRRKDKYCQVLSFLYIFGSKILEG